jgi:hypothetical protein
MDKSAKVVEGTVEVKAKNLYNRMEWAGAFGDVGTHLVLIALFFSDSVAIFSRYSPTRSWA